MSEMVERVARAIVEAAPYSFGAKRSGFDGIDKESARYSVIMAMARAAIAAMREPTEAMADAFWSSVDEDVCDIPLDYPLSDAYSAMIDAALTA